MKVKLCGFKDRESLLAAVKSGCNFVGLVFYQNSQRFISTQDAATLVKLIPDSISKVAIVVDADFSYLKQIYQSFKPDYFQLHGREDSDYIKQVRLLFPKVKIIKAFGLSDINSFPSLDKYESCCDLYLFDSKSSGHGGSGKKFDWAVLDVIKSDKAWFLSGGINIDNIDLVLKNPKVKMVDISSGIEEVKGFKSISLISQIMQKIKDNANSG